MTNRPRPRVPAPAEMTTIIEPVLTSPPSCRLIWGETQIVWPVATVRDLAAAMLTAAARAEAEAGLLALMKKVGLGNAELGVLMSELRATYETQVLGRRGEFTLVAGVSMYDRSPFVHVNAGPYEPIRFTPGNLRELSTSWTQVAEASEHDAVMTYALAEAGLPPATREAVFTAARQVRPGGIRDHERPEADHG